MADLAEGAASGSVKAEQEQASTLTESARRQLGQVRARCDDSKWRVGEDVDQPRSKQGALIDNYCRHEAARLIGVTYPWTSILGQQQTQGPPTERVMTVKCRIKRI